MMELVIKCEKEQMSRVECVAYAMFGRVVDIEVELVEKWFVCFVRNSFSPFFFEMKIHLEIIYSVCSCFMWEGNPRDSTSTITMYY